MNKTVALNQEESCGVSGGMCICYKDKNFTEVGVEVNSKSNSCKHRCCRDLNNKPSSQNQAWRYSDLITHGPAREENAKGLCGSHKKELTGKSLFKLVL